MGTQSTWGLISRVSSRTYREQSNMFTSIASRALRTSVARQNKLKFYGGDGQNVLAKALTLALHHNKNGNIKYRVYKTQMTGLKLDSDLWLVGCMAFGLGSFYLNIFGNPNMDSNAPISRLPVLELERTRNHTKARRPLLRNLELLPNLRINSHFSVGKTNYL